MLQQRPEPHAAALAIVRHARIDAALLRAPMAAAVPRAAYAYVPHRGVKVWFKRMRSEKYEFEEQKAQYS